MQEAEQLTMTQRDRDRLVALKKADKKLITQREAATEMGVTERHMRRLLKALRTGGDKGILHGLRGTEVEPQDRGRLSGGSPIVIPGLNPAATSTPNLVVFGGKQGNLYLADRSHMPGSTTVRPGCGTDASKDTSLLPPGIQPQFGTRGPLNVFGPYSDTLSNTDYAKSRSTPAYFQVADGTSYIFHTGSSKVNANSTTTVPPGIARLKIVTASGQPAYAALDQYESTLSLLSPGSPVVTSNGSSSAVLWVPVANVLRSVNFLTTTSHPILYAFDPFTFKILWQSTTSQLNVAGSTAPSRWCTARCSWGRTGFKRSGSARFLRRSRSTPADQRQAFSSRTNSSRAGTATPSRARWTSRAS